MFVINEDRKERTELSEGINNIQSCTFIKLGSELENGGAVCCSNENSQLIVSESSFYNCIGKTGGAVFTSVWTVDFVRNCANGCNNTDGYGLFASLDASSSISVSLLSMSHNKGAAATAKFGCPKQTLMNINTTNNRASKECGYITTKSEVSTSKFINVASNEMQYIGINFHSGESYFVSFLNYKNCSFFNQGSYPYHVFIHLVSTGASFNNCYVSSLTYPMYALNSVNVSVSDSFFPSSFDIQGIETGSNVINAQTKTLIFSLVNTRLCPAAHSNSCTKMIKKRKTFSFLIMLCLSLHIK